MEHRKYLQIAIDGPVGSGKSDISARLAKKIGLTYLYTGAMYRALAWLCVKNNVPFKVAIKVMGMLRHHQIELTPPKKTDERGFSVAVDGVDITDELFTKQIDRGSSDVSTIAEARKFMVDLQQHMAQGRSVVMEGRDIGLRVLPHADLKIYLTASLEERARRRWEQKNKKFGIKESLSEVISDTRSRDTQDMTRKADPLVKLPDAWELDTTGMTQNNVVETIIGELRKRKLL